jgi:hypothetical protein
MKELIKRILHEEFILEQRTFWTVDMVKELAKNFDKLVDFRKEHPQAVQWAQKHKVLDDITSHMYKKTTWTKEDIMTLAKQFTKIKDFQNAYPGAYASARNNKWIDDVTSHMVRQKTIWTLKDVLELAKKTKNMEDFRNTYTKAYDAARHHKGWKEEVWKLFEPQQVNWTYELAKSIADKYDDLTDFTNKETKAIAAIRRLGWLDLLLHMQKDKRTWTDNEIRNEAKKYQTISDFRKYAKNAMDAAINHGIYDEVTKHMKRAYTDWTKDMVWKEALKYETRSEFMRGNYAAYQAAHNKGWFDDVTTHMDRIGNLYKRLVYAYEFSDNSVYVGLTFNKKDRDARHKQKEKSAVFQHIKKTGLKPTMKIISDDYIDAEDAINLEGCTISQYKLDGWNILNKAKAGGLGGCSKVWKKEDVAKLALQYTNPTKFKSKHSSAFKAAENNGWLPEITQHMTKKIKWTENLLLSYMSKYNSQTDFRKYDYDAWAAAYRILGNERIKNYYLNKGK